MQVSKSKKKNENETTEKEIKDTVSQDDLTKKNEKNIESKDNLETNKNIVEEDVNDLKKKLEEKEKQAAEYLEMAQRLKAEFENYRKRTEKEKSEMIDYGQEKVILELLPVIDNFERALMSEGDLTSYKEGVELIYKQFKKILDNLGVEEIKAEGEIFDPYKHHAVMQDEVEDKKENEIIEVFQKGYTLKDKVIRPSMVKVAK
ncbi:MAG: nucleotide exchange factor GrpE [Thermoanaerobacteraceae bacterium]